MGAGKSVLCRTCRTDFYIGYGSYRRRPYGDTLAEAEGMDDCWGKDAYLKFIREHEGHDFIDWSEDAEYGTEPDGHLYMMGPYGNRGDVVAENYKEYKHVDLTRVSAEHP